MKKNLAKIATGVLAGISTLYRGTLVMAQGQGNPGPGTNTVSLCPSGTFSPLCTDVPGLGAIISALLNAILFVAFIAALVFLIIGGIKWILSGGDKEGTGKAKETVTSALIGLAVVLGAWILINIVLNFFGFTGGITALPIPKLK